MRILHEIQLQHQCYLLFQRSAATALRGEKMYEQFTIKTNENDLLAVDGVPLWEEGNEPRECLLAANNESAICGRRRSLC